MSCCLSPLLQHYESMEEAKAAVAGLDGSDLCGQNIKVQVKRGNPFTSSCVFDFLTQGPNGKSKTKLCQKDRVTP